MPKLRPTCSRCLGNHTSSLHGAEHFDGLHSPPPEGVTRGVILQSDGRLKLAPDAAGTQVVSNFFSQAPSDRSVSRSPPLGARLRSVDYDRMGRKGLVARRIIA